MNYRLMSIYIIITNTFCNSTDNFQSEQDICESMLTSDITVLVRIIQNKQSQQLNWQGIDIAFV